jgi:hypothetical protein
MDHDLARLADRSTAGSVDSRSLGLMGATDPAGAFSAGRPRPIVGHDVDTLVIAHVFALLMAGLTRYSSYAYLDDLVMFCHAHRQRCLGGEGDEFVMNSIRNRHA